MLQEVVQRYQDSHPGLPMVMGGVSMGGMVATLTVIRKQEMWKVGALLILTLLHAGVQRMDLAGQTPLLLSPSRLPYKGCCFGIAGNLWRWIFNMIAQRT